MPSTRNQPHTRSLIASLTVSAGALAIGSAAHASIVTTTLNHNDGVIGGTVTGDYFVALGGVAHAIDFEGYTNGNFFALATRSSTYLQFKVNSVGISQIVTGTAGQKWSDLTAFDALSSVGSLLAQNGTTGAEFGPFPAGNQYYAFEFKDSTSQLDYGWFSASLHDTGLGNAWANIDQIAYDTTGAEIAMGDTGAAVPEPASIGLLALAAMVTGAARTRRFKRARAAA